MGKYEELGIARAEFGIGESETLREIKRKIKKRLKECHPDTGETTNAEREEKTIRLIEAQKQIIDYCDRHKISFAKTEVEKYLSPGERWLKKFGSDHVWGGNV